MNKKMRKWLEANGLRADATELEAWELYDKLKGEGIELIGVEPGKRSAAAGNPAQGDRGNQDDGGEVPATRTETDPGLQAQIDAAVVRGMVAEANRRNAVQDLIVVAGLGDHDGGTFARQLLDNPQIDVNRASNLILTELQKRNPPIGSGAHVGREAGEKLRDAITDGLLMRSGHRLAKPADGAKEFRGRALIEICRELLELNGVSCRGLSRMEIAGRALAAGSTSDLPFIFSSVVNKNLLQAYNEWPDTWRPWVAITGAMDFKEIHAIKLSGSPDLKGMNENGEYQTAFFSDAQESYRVITKGIKVPFTRQMIINDDTRALTRIPQLFGTSAKRMEADAVYSLLTANGAMSDGKNLFHADHRNLAAAGAVLGSDSLGVGRAAMRKQKGLKGERIDIVPAFLLVPVILELAAEVILRSASLPTAEMSAGVHNPWAGKLTPVADPHLDDASEKAWYLLGSPNQAPVIEAAFLEGEEQPYVEEMIDFNSDAMIIKVRHDFGAGVVDHVGAYKNPGE